METIKLIKIMVDARTGYRADMFDKVYSVVTGIMNKAVSDAGDKYPDYRSMFAHVPFYDEHDTERVYADTWLVPKEFATAAIEKATAHVTANSRFLDNQSYIKVVEVDTVDLELAQVSEADKLAQKYVASSPALFSKVIHRMGNSTFFGDRDGERRMKKFIDVPDYAVHSYGFVSVSSGSKVTKFTLLTYVYSGVSQKERQKYIEYVKANPDDVIIADNYESDRRTPKDIPLGNVSKADFLEAYWKVADERERRR